MSFNFTTSRAISDGRSAAITSSPFSSPFGGLGFGAGTETISVRRTERRPLDEFDLKDVSNLHGPSAYGSRARYSSSTPDTYGNSPRAATVRSEVSSSGGPNYFSTASYKSPYGNSVRMASCPGMSQYLPK